MMVCGAEKKRQLHRGGSGDYGHDDVEGRGGVHVWIFAEKTQQLLLVQRHHHFQGLWDASTAAIIISPHSPLTTARRKLQQELGLTLAEDAFEFIFSFLQQESGSGRNNGGKEINNDVYLVTTIDPIPLEAFTLQRENVSSVKYVSYQEYESLLAKNDPHYVPYDVHGQYAQLFEIITKSNPDLREWLKEHADESELNKLKWSYYKINKSPWSSLDKDEAFLTSADSAIKVLPNATTKTVTAWKGLEYRAAFPVQKPLCANFYPQDMDKKEFETWKGNLDKDQQKEATGFFSVIKRHSNSDDDNDLHVVPYSQEYKSLLAKAADLLHKAGDITTSLSLKRLLHAKADAFLSNDYYESDIAWMDLDSKLDVTIGPYETYEDKLFGYKATFEAFIGIRDDKATAQLKLFGDSMQLLEQNLPMDNAYKSEDVSAAPIRVIQLIYNAGDVKGPQIVAFNLPNDERIVKERGTSMVMLKNVQEAKFERILMPIAELCVAKEQQELVDFESFFTHTICHECVHGIGPHTITLPNGQKSTVRLELQEFYSAIEEAKADIVGLWALRFLISKALLSESLVKTMYVSFLAGCFRSVRFGLEEAHGKGQALQFNWIHEKGGFVVHSDETVSVEFSKIENAVESLSREILTIQAKGDKQAAASLLDKYGVITEPLKVALKNLETVEVPVDIVPNFPILAQI
ncbi:hypothetical protein Ahy_A07g032204 [Arachis hypogaea]|uniref:Nudix hydrolase domain-containing protein n=1 Tax=Arachis hypogaea TaxID=3818 RepID=A0A445C6A3_ARAHY|nr:hypothetical protein Ahy_A07g032204 [Arachis hypogaea]